jgi:competence protein ComGC
MQNFLYSSYFLVVLLVFVWLLSAFVSDRSTPKTDLRSWIVLLIASALWPIMLPNLIRVLFRKTAQLSNGSAEQTKLVNRSKAQMERFEEELQK